MEKVIKDLINGYKIARDLRKIDDEQEWDKYPKIEDTKMWREHWVIPIAKLKGERFGQIIFNAIASSCKPHDFYNDHQIADRLFQIENKELEKLINKYLRRKK